MTLSTTRPVGTDPDHDGARRLPLTAAQAAIWYAQQLDPTDPSFVTAEYADLVLEPGATLDPALLAGALGRTVAEAPQLLATVERGPDGEPLQLVRGDPGGPELPVHDLREGGEPAARAWIEADLSRATDLGAGPLLSSALLRVDEQRWWWYLRVHHLALDGYGFTLVWRRLAEIVGAVTDGREAGPGPFAPLDGVLAEEAERADTEQADTDRDWWHAQFADRPVPHVLGPRDPAAQTDTHPDTHPDTHRPTLHASVDLAPGVVDALDALAADRHVTRAEVLVAALGAYTHRTAPPGATGTTVLGVPLMGRVRTAALRVPTTAVSVLPLRLAPTDADTVARVVDDTSAAFAALRAHQRHRGEDLRRGLGLVGGERRLSGPVINLKPDPLTLRLPTATGPVHAVATGPVDDVAITPERDRLLLAASPRRFTADDLDALAARLAAFVEAFATGPDHPLGTLEVATEPERRTEAAAAAEPPVAPGPAATLPEVFDRAAAIDPTAVAVTGQAVTGQAVTGQAVTGQHGDLTYGELDARSARLARTLIDDGVGPDDVVAVVLDREPAFVVTVLAVLRAGATYLPLEVRHPAARLAATLADAAPTVVLVTAATAGLVPPDAVVRTLDDPDDVARVERASAAPVTDADRRRPLRADDGAHLIYTSGSTGRPKGVLVPHRAVVDLLDSTRAGFAFAASDVWTWYHSGAFDFSVWELWGALAHGARVVVVPADVARSPREFLALLARERVTVLNQTPSAFAALAAADAEHPADLGALRLVIFGGEALAPPRLRDWASRHDPDTVALVNMFGITETTVHVTWHRLRSADLARSASVVGRPLPGRSVRLLDAAGRQVPPGSVGEMVVGGQGLALGYRGRPDLTAARFVGSGDDRAYRSGDLARREPDGTLVHLGRADDQVQLRGHRVEPAEIAAALLDLPAVTDAAVVLREDVPGDPRLVAYVTGTGTATGLRAHLVEVLPAHLVPSAVVVLGTLPVTVNGKLDRAALPAPDRDEAGSPLASDRAASPAAHVVAGLVGEVLGLPGPCAVDDDFFALGGHSLSAMRLIARIRAVLGVEPDIRAVFADPTPTAVAAAATGGHDAVRPALAPHDGRHPGLSPAQRRMWFRQRVDGPVATYHVPWAVEIRGPLDLPALSRAVGDVVARHESLRTVVPARGGEPAARLLGVDEVPAPEVHEVAEADLDDALAAAARRGFDLAAEPPLRATVFRVRPDRTVLLLVTHHIASDDASLRPLARDLSAAYRARCARYEGPSALPALPVQYRDYTAWQAELLGDPDDEDSRLGRELAFWTATLEGLPDRLELPTDHPRPPVATGRGGHVRLHLDARVHDGLRALARRHGVSEFMVLHAALAVLCHRLGAGDDIAIGTPVAGRTDEALEDLVGFFVNTLVLRTDLAGPDLTVAGLLERVRDTDLAALAHQDAPFDQVVEAVNPPRALDRHPLFGVMLALGTGEPTPELAGCEVGTRTVATGTAKFDLTVSLSPDRSGDGLRGYLEYARDLYTEAGAATIAARFARVVRAVVDTPDAPVAGVDILSAPERHTLVHAWNDTDAPVPQATVVDMIDEVVRTRPDAPAVVFEGLQLTYAELDARATRLAHRLARLGVGPERTVGIHLERGVELVVGLLATLKAGGAFVPLDRAWPPVRLAEVARAARPVAVLSTGAGPGLDGGAGDVPLVDPLDPTLAGEPTTPLEVEIDPESLAYVIYTSGSTGTPKGAMIRHEAISNRLPWQVGLLDLTADDAVLFKAPLTFDISVNEVLLPLVVGARLVVAAPGAERDVSSLLDLVAAQRVTFVYLVSTMLDLMLARDDVAERAGSLRHVWCGGEVLTPELYRRFAERLDATMYHGYGPAEATIGVTCEVYRGQLGAGITIGRPNPNTRVYVLDAGMSPVPVGVPGELYLGGVPLGRGYLDDPVRTADRFVPDPVSGRPGERLYATGDLARLRPDGAVEFLGRADNQVKIRGMRVELEEIEAVLAGHPRVRQAVVLLTDTTGPAALRAFVAVERDGDGGGESDLPAHLVDWLADRLPAHMVPDRVHVVRGFPLMPSGKIDRATLAGTVPDEPVSRGPAVAVEPGLERTVATAWEEVLGVTGISGADNFFDLGGHSLLLAQVQARLQREIGHSVPMLDLFTHATVRGLASYLAAESTGGGRESLGMLLPLRPEGSATPVFCVHPASGLAWPFAGLRQHLGDDVPLWGVQARGLDGAGAAVASSLDEMAREYLTAIRTVAPHGPYRLVGWSFGGVVAHTMATLLQAEGERVELLAMLDSYPAYPWERLATDHEQQALRSLLYMSHYDLEALPEGPLDRDVVTALVARQGGILAELPPESIDAVMGTFVNSAVLQQGFRHSSFAGDVTFFTATVNPIDPTLSAADWAPYVDGTVRDHPVACEHKDMTQAGPLAVIGRTLAAALEAAARPRPEETA